MITPGGTLRIGELAARTGRSVHTIRWYETQRLMPGVSRDSGRRRVYQEMHVGWLDLLDKLRRTGMTIRQMREYTQLFERGETTLQLRQDLLRAHRAQVQREIAELGECLRLIEAKIGFYGEWLASGRRPANTPCSPAVAAKSTILRTAKADIPRTGRPAPPSASTRQKRTRHAVRTTVAHKELT